MSLSAAELDIEAESVLPGAEGLLVQDHFAGNKSPHINSIICRLLFSFIFLYDKKRITFCVAVVLHCPAAMFYTMP